MLTCRAPLMIMLNCAVAVFDAESVTFMVKFDVPGVVGVPEIILLVRLRPVGNEPENDAPHIRRRTSGSCQGVRVGGADGAARRRRGGYG